MAAGALNWSSSLSLPAAQIARVLDAVRPREAREQADAPAMPLRRGTPEIYFTKAIDNSRLVKVANPGRARETRQFVAACAVLFALMMVYAWQHFSAVEYGYKIEQARSQRDAQVEVNRQLHLEEAALRDPERIDQLAHKMGLAMPKIDQVSALDAAPVETSVPVMAKVADAPVETAALR